MAPSRSLTLARVAGGSTIFARGFDAGLFWDLLESSGATWYYAGPTIHHQILQEFKNRQFTRYQHKIRCGTLFPQRCSRSLISAGAARQQADRQRCRGTSSGSGPGAEEHIWGNDPAVLWHDGMVSPFPFSIPFPGPVWALGSSRKTADCAPCVPWFLCSMPISTPPIDYKLERPGTSGRAVGPQLKILDDAGKELPPGTMGNICVRGKPLFPAYEANDDANAEAFLPGGWFNTGDMGHLDGDGYLYITGPCVQRANVMPMKTADLGLGRLSTLHLGRTVQGGHQPRGGDHLAVRDRGGHDLAPAHQGLPGLLRPSRRAAGDGGAGGGDRARRHATWAQGPTEARLPVPPPIQVAHARGVHGRDAQERHGQAPPHQPRHAPGDPGAAGRDGRPGAAV
jgi:hypothetical protein